VEGNVEVFDGRGRFVARVDLLFRAYGEVLEYHGDHHRTDLRQWRHDRTREAELESLGLHVMEVTNADLATPRLLVARIARNLQRRGWRGELAVSRWFPAG
jgi:very-short-patch-repair endonuclease